MSTMIATGLRGSERIHLIGIGGSGMSAIARVLLERGHFVSGSDLQDSPLLQELGQLGAHVYVGHQAEHIGDVDLVVVTSAASKSNPEVVEALRRGLPVWPRAQMLRQLTAGRRCLAVAGTHGKTTTTAMLALLLRTAGLDPSYIVGGVVPELGGNAHAGQGPHFVLEADEYDRTFLALQPAVAIVTNVDWDHVDCYPTPADAAAAFAEFIAHVQPNGAVYLCRDDAGAWSLPRPAAPVLGYGLAPGADWQAVEVQLEQEKTAFTAQHQGQAAGHFVLHLPGEHNVRNAMAALAVAGGEGVNLSQVSSALAGFGGAQRRFQQLGTAANVTFVDDYAHHPGEVRATLAAARQRFPGRRLVAVFQPHTYSRTRAFIPDLAEALSLADVVLVTAIYAAREVDPGDVSAAEIAQRVRRHPPDVVAYVSNLDEAQAWLLRHLEPGDVVLTLGAGDITGLGRRVLAEMSERPRTEEEGPVATS